MDLGAPLTPEEQVNLALLPLVSSANSLRPKLVNTGKQVLNYARCKLTGLAGNEIIKIRAIETFRKYGIINKLNFLSRRTQKVLY